MNIDIQVRVVRDAYLEAMWLESAAIFPDRNKYVGFEPPEFHITTTLEDHVHGWKTR